MLVQVQQKKPLLSTRCAPTWCAGMSVPASFALLHSLAGGLSEDNPLQLSELQDLQIVHHHSDIRHHIVGQISWQHLSIWLGREQTYLEICIYNAFIIINPNKIFLSPLLSSVMWI